ncbi:MAG: hypothetical protein JWN11_2637, partial [Hyphomicrobiales bacterium]|nr:hypothetical protein [Hyphomicrobiales bacterium]
PRGVGLCQATEGGSGTFALLPQLMPS